MIVNKLLEKLFFIFFKITAKNHKCRPHRHVGKIVVIYRICDKGNPKDKPDYITKEKCLSNAVSCFPLSKVTWHVIADNCSDETYQMILNYVPTEKVERVNVGSGSGTFRMACDIATRCTDNDLIYFLEDDYLHLPGSLESLIAVAEHNYADYITLYDHPDKYGESSVNPYVEKGGEATHVFWTGNRHWKFTNSTTMTFAAFADVVRRDKDIYWRWTYGYIPSDFCMFIHLSMFRKAKLLSPIPSLSTHGESRFLAVGVDWRTV